MRNKLLVGSVVALGWFTLARRGLSQGIELGDYLREGGVSGAGAHALGVEGKLSTILGQGVTKYRNKEYDSAISYFTAALQMNPESSLKARIYEVRAEAFIGKRDIQKALADATEAIRLDRRLALAYNTRGVAYGSVGDTTKAIADFDAALRLDPNFQDAQRNRALAEHRKKR